MSTGTTEYLEQLNREWHGADENRVFREEDISRAMDGPSNFDAGYIYAPYVPLTQTPPVLDPNSFSPRRNLVTRYSPELLREGARFYGRISVGNAEFECTKPVREEVAGPVNWKQEGF